MINSVVTLMEMIIYGGTIRSLSKELGKDLREVETVDDLLK